MSARERVTYSLQWTLCTAVCFVLCVQQRRNDVMIFEHTYQVYTTALCGSTFKKYISYQGQKLLVAAKKIIYFYIFKSPIIDSHLDSNYKKKNKLTNVNKVVCVATPVFLLFSIAFNLSVTFILLGKIY